MDQTLSPISLFDIQLRAVPRYSQDFVVVLGLASLQIRLGLFQFDTQRSNIYLLSSEFQSRLEVRDRGVI